MKWINAHTEMKPADAKQGKRIHIKFCGEPHILTFIDGKWCFFRSNSLISHKPVDDDQWEHIEWLLELES